MSDETRITNNQPAAPSACETTESKSGSLLNSRGCCSNEGIGRRLFLKAVGLGVASHVLHSPAGAMAGPFTAGDTIKHFVPADKKLAPEWVRSLFERGISHAFHGKELDAIGMPVGGIGAGQLYLRGDGTLGSWQIFNHHHFTGHGEHNYAYREPDSPVDQGFAVLVEDEGRLTAATLDRHGFSRVEFTGEYPVAWVGYRDEGSPIRVQMTAFSPFVPLNTADSTLPATVFHIIVHNVSSRTLRAGILAWLENAVCFHSRHHVDAIGRSRVVSDKDGTFIIHTAEPAPADTQREPRTPILLADFEGDDYGDWVATGEAFGGRPAAGTLENQNPVSGFRGQGLVNSFLGGDEPTGTLTSAPFVVSRRFINFLVGGGHHAGQTCVNLLIDGQVVRTATGRQTEELAWHTWKVDEFEGRQARIQIVDQHSGAWGHILVDDIEMADERRVASEPLEQLYDYGSMVMAFPGEAASPQQLQEWLALAGAGLGDLAAGLALEAEAAFPLGQRRTQAAAVPLVEMGPGAEHTFVFVLGWHFPHLKRPHQPVLGRQYAGRFTDAAAVARYVLDNHRRLAGQTLMWHHTFYDSTLPYWLLDRIGSTVSNLATDTCEWWRNGRFWAWEGVGCCSGTCTHVWNYAQALGRLFPRLERSVREMQDLEAALHPDGLVGFRGTRDGHYAADGQAGTVLKCYREHQMSPDDRFLRRNWPRIRQVLEYSIRQDGNDDGLIENSQHNTYDINFVGPNTFVGALYLAALRAGEEMAREVSDDAFADRLRAIFESGRRLTLERLWNGEYFIHEVDLEKHPKHQYGTGCLTDQLFGQLWAHQVGLGYLYPVQNVRKALESVWTYNWAPDITPQNEHFKPWRWFVSPGEAGMFVCTWPRGGRPEEPVLYRDEVWTGCEYQAAAHMIHEGMLTEGMVAIRAIHDRYHPLKRNPFNEVECGDHYARALASWSALIALAGYEYHGPRGHLGFAPRLTPEDFRAPFTAAEGWGTLSQRREADTQHDRIDLRWGRLRLHTLAFELPDAAGEVTVQVTCGGRPVPAGHTLDRRRCTIILGDGGITLEAGQGLEAVIGRA